MTNFNEILNSGAYQTYLDAVQADEAIQRGKKTSEKFGEDFPMPTTIDPEFAAEIALGFKTRAQNAAQKITGSSI